MATTSKHGGHASGRGGAGAGAVGAGGTPLPGGFMPPLDRLDQNHYGGTPTPGAGAVGGTGGFGVSGATPSPAGGMTAHAGHTSGPRLGEDRNGTGWRGRVGMR